MRTATFFAFFLAMFALICSAVSAETSLEPRATKDVGAAFEGTLDLLVKEHSDIVLKAYADVCTDADLSTAISSNLRVQISGLINFDFGLGSKFSSALHTSVKAAVKKEVNAHIKTEFSANLRANMAAIITKRCPNHDAACIKLEAKFIVKDAVKLTTKASAKISDKISTKLAVKIKSAIDIEVKKFSINLLLIKINVSGDLDVSDSVSLRFKSAAGICAQACIDISAKEISKIKTICSA